MSRKGCARRGPAPRPSPLGCLGGVPRLLPGPWPCSEQPGTGPAVRPPGPQQGRPLQGPMDLRDRPLAHGKDELPSMGAIAPGLPAVSSAQGKPAQRGLLWTTLQRGPGIGGRGTAPDCHQTALQRCVPVNVTVLHGHCVTVSNPHVEAEGEASHKLLG